MKVNPEFYINELNLDTSVSITSEILTHLTWEIYDQIQKIGYDFTHPFSNVKIVKTTNALGIASSKGVISLSIKLFGNKSGKDVYECLIDTILHEFAHLIAGVNAGHGRIWRNLAMHLGASPTTKTVIPVEMQVNRYKYTIYMHTKCGDIILYKNANNKMKKHLNAHLYDWSLKDGRKIEKFEYRNYEG